VQAEFVNQTSINAILFPEGIDPDQRSDFGSAQSILPHPFLLDRGASGMPGTSRILVLFASIDYFVPFLIEVPISAVNIRMDNIDAFLPSDGLK
jgi:hypothetical protein